MLQRVHISKTLEGHGSEVTSVAFSPDGKTLASGSNDDTIRLWDVVTGAEVRTFIGHTAQVNSVAFSPDGKTLASGSGSWGNDGNTIRLWDVVTGTEMQMLEGHTGGVSTVAFSPDGSTLASGSRDHTLRLWDVVTGAEIQTLDRYTHGVNSVAFSPDGSTLANSSSVNVHLWDVVTGAHKQTLEGHRSEVWSVAFSPDGQTLASGGASNSVRLWDVTTGAHKQTLEEHTDELRISTSSPAVSVAFSPDGQTLASGRRNGTILLWKLTPSIEPPTPVEPDPTTVTVSVLPSPVQSPAIGEQLTLSLSIVGGENVAGYQATVGFDPSALRYVESANGDYLPAGAFAVDPIVTDNAVTLASTSLTGESNDDGALATLTFEVIAVKASTLTLSDVILSDSVGKSSQPHIQNGQIVEPSKLKGDVNRDGVVNILDLVIVAISFGQSGQNSADVNGDGVVNIQDLVLVAEAFGNAAAPSLHPQSLAMLTAADIEGWLSQARQLDLTDARLQRGLIFLEHLLAALPPKETALLPNYPNPFNPETWIPYHLAHTADVQISIYDTKGVLVRRLDLGRQAAGFYTTRILERPQRKQGISGKWCLFLSIPCGGLYRVAPDGDCQIGSAHTMNCATTSIQR